MDIDGVLETLKSELERVKINLWNEQSGNKDEISNIVNSAVKEIDEEIHTVKSEEKLICILNGRVKQMNRLLSLSSEILLLSAKHKYMPQHIRYNNPLGSPAIINQGCLEEPAILTSSQTIKKTSVPDKVADQALIDENS